MQIMIFAAIPGRVRDNSLSKASTGLQGLTHWLHVCRRPPLTRPAGQPARAPGQRRRPPAHSRPARLRPRRPASLPRPPQAPPGEPALRVQSPAARPQARVAAPGSCWGTSVCVSTADLTDVNHFKGSLTFPVIVTLVNITWQPASPAQPLAQPAPWRHPPSRRRGTPGRGARPPPAAARSAPARPRARCAPPQLLLRPPALAPLCPCCIALQHSDIALAIFHEDIWRRLSACALFVEASA